jgi:hypothetical protein
VNIGGSDKAPAFLQTKQEKKMTEEKQSKWADLTGKVKAVIVSAIVAAVAFVADAIGGFTGQVIGDEAQRSAAGYIIDWLF